MALEGMIKITMAVALESTIFLKPYILKLYREKSRRTWCQGEFDKTVFLCVK